MEYPYPSELYLRRLMFWLMVFIAISMTFLVDIIRQFYGYSR